MKGISRIAPNAKRGKSAAYYSDRPLNIKAEISPPDTPNTPLKFDQGHSVMIKHIRTGDRAVRGNRVRPLSHVRALCRAVPSRMLMLPCTTILMELRGPQPAARGISPAGAGVAFARATGDRAVAGRPGVRQPCTHEHARAPRRKLAVAFRVVGIAKPRSSPVASMRRGEPPCATFRCSARREGHARTMSRARRRCRNRGRQTSLDGKASPFGCFFTLRLLRLAQRGNHAASTTRPPSVCHSTQGQWCWQYKPKRPRGALAHRCYAAHPTGGAPLSPASLRPAI